MIAANCSQLAIEYFADHAIDPQVAAAAGVVCDGSEITYPYTDGDGETFFRRRNLTGSKTLQPLGVPLEPWAPIDHDGVLLICEGESDLMAVASILFEVEDLALAGDPADLYLSRRSGLPPPIAELVPVALPGAGVCHKKVADLVERKMADAWIALDGDKTGRAGAAKLKAKIDAKQGISAGILELPEGRDLSDVLSVAENPAEALAGLVAAADLAADVVGGDLTPSGDGATVQPPVDRQAEWEKCELLATAPSVLNLFTDQLARAGLVGEDKLAKIIYLATTSRMLSKPVNVAVKGPSAGGKSFTVEVVLNHFPGSAYYALSAMSERALAYSEEPLVNRMLVIYEAAGMESDFASYLLRSLLSEGCVRYETVEKTKDGMKARLIERPGPTGLVVTTTRTNLHPENETRLISLVVKDTPDQTRAVMRAIADEDAPVLDTEPWHALQRWLQPRPVTVPYAKQLAELVPAVAVRLRRDFGSVLGLIRAHALLHQATRSEDAQGRIIATIEDYAVVRGLVSDLVASGVGAGVSKETRETVDAVDRLADGEGISQKSLSVDLGLDKSAVSRRVRVATREGYLRNLEDRRGRPARLVIGDPLPENLEILPPPDAISGCTVARLIEGDNQNGRNAVVSDVANGQDPLLATPDEEAEAERLAAKFGAVA